MSETETPAETPAKSGGFHLPVLPEGWRYGIYMTGPDRQSITVSYGDLGRGPRVHVSTGLDEDANGHKSFDVESLPAGVAQAAKIVRTLRDLHAHEEKTRTAREALLSQIGRPSPQLVEGSLDTPDSLGSATDAAEPRE